MGLVKIIGAFLSLWIVFYITAYVLYMSPDDSTTKPNLHNNAETNNIVKSVLKSSIGNTFQDANNMGIIQPAVGTNPFLSATCTFRTHQARDFLSHDHAAMSSVGIVIPARNENKEELLKTIESIIKNSGDELKKIIIVDDFSTVAIESWPEWQDFYVAANTRFGGKNMKNNVLQIMRMQHRNGVAKSKAFGAEQLHMSKLDVLVFLDAHVLVSKDWLMPLITALNKHPEALVYPAIDIIDGDTKDLIKGANSVGAFDWGLNFRWEILDEAKKVETKQRLPLSTTDNHGHFITEVNNSWNNDIYKLICLYC